MGGPREKHRRGHAAFTLTELLVVTGIIAVLLGLAVPAATYALRRARTAGCLAHLREIGQLLNDWVAAHHGVMPTLYNRSSRDDTVPALDTVLSHGPNPVFRCPADRRGLYEETGTSYFWNFTVNGQPIDTLFSLAGGRNPDRIPLVVDKEPFHPDVPDGLNTLYASGRVGQRLDLGLSQ